MIPCAAKQDESVPKEIPSPTRKMSKLSASVESSKAKLVSLKEEVPTAKNANTHRKSLQSAFNHMIGSMKNLAKQKAHEHKKDTAEQDRLAGVGPTEDKLVRTRSAFN
eukprot:NODE_2466_length_1416_cov_74.454756_g2346_i0.p3 GENE.NODE_2466_length_1416_cov_74.454756_g2346_i0~~NODE_2466_length_1416_cov_74.454756_g2346_i0.p3  ORF type:complete len:108 (+),score=16.39 NODE_2466_length_1416_cov_74.454756_g2346_i0:186-509(+)